MLLLLQAYSIFLLWTHSKVFSVNSVVAQDLKASSAPPAVPFVGGGAAAEPLNNVSSSPPFLSVSQEASSSIKDSHLDSASTSVLDSDSDLVEATKNSSRNRRQLYFEPNIGYLQNVGEGTTCITTRGFSGSCVSFRSCHPYQRYGRHLALLTVRQWPLTPPPLNPEYCTFYDQNGWPNSGICCTNELSNAVGNFGPVPVWPVQQQPTFIVQAERPIQGQPPLPELPTVEEESEVVDAGVGVDEEQYNNTEMDSNNNNSHTNNDSNSDDSANVDPPEDSDTDVLEISPDFQDVNNAVYDPIHESDEKPSTPVLYDDYRYQWPHFTNVQQHWPPPLPTHPPSNAQWPPPIPTHPPNHHYPTHPASPAQDTSTLIATHNTTRGTSTSLRPTTTRRPSRPIYPTYPFYPTTKPRPPATTTTTSSTTRRPPTSEATSSLGLPLKCGMKNGISPDQERIVGGSNASPNEFPWIAVLFRAGRQFCGGSLITKSHILTAAHCVARMTSWDVAAITVHLGDYDIRNNFEVKHVERRVKRLVRHKGFQFSTLHNDVAILTLSDPIRFTNEIQPICLPISSAQQARSYSGHVATVAGWGSLHENGPQPSILQKVSIPIWSNSECARKYGRAAPAGIISSMLCAGQTARDSCSGDSGGPLIVKEGGRYTQVGIVSWGIGCGKGHYPGVYTRVTSLLPWIYKNIKQ